MVVHVVQWLMMVSPRTKNFWFVFLMLVLDNGIFIRNAHLEWLVLELCKALHLSCII